MTKATTNQLLNAARAIKDDEFYTPFEFIAAELDRYDFGGAPIVCPCDSDRSNFVAYFRSKGIEPVYNAGDYRYALRRAPKGSIVVTNPPFSLFRDFVNLLLNGAPASLLFNTSPIEPHRFIVVGHKTAPTLRPIFKAIKEGRLWTSDGGPRNCHFYRPTDGETKEVGVNWFTNLEPTSPAARRSIVSKKGYTVADLKELGLYKFIDDRPNVLYIDRIENIPVDYVGLIAVPFSDPHLYAPPIFEYVDLVSAPVVDGATHFSKVIVRKILKSV